MVIGVLSIVLSIPGSNSLKDKRQVVKSVLDGIRNKFNCSAAEIDNLDSHRRAGLAFTVVGNDKSLVNRILDKILDYIDSNPLCEVIESDLQLI